MQDAGLPTATARLAGKPFRWWAVHGRQGLAGGRAGEPVHDLGHSSSRVSRVLVAPSSVDSRLLLRRRPLGIVDHQGRSGPWRRFDVVWWYRAARTRRRRRPATLGRAGERIPRETAAPHHDATRTPGHQPRERAALQSVSQEGASPVPPSSQTGAPARVERSVGRSPVGVRLAGRRPRRGTAESRVREPKDRRPGRGAGDHRDVVGECRASRCKGRGLCTPGRRSALLGRVRVIHWRAALGASLRASWMHWPPSST